MVNQEEKRTVKTINPATNQVEKEFPYTTDEQLQSIFETADKAFQVWKNTSFENRSQLLTQVSDLMRQRIDDLARLCSIEMGKLFKEAKGEIEVCITILDYYARNGKEILKDKPIDIPQGKAFIAYSPLGVVFSIQPWNFPFYQVIRSAAPSLMAGNTYVLKHAGNVPQCALAIEQLFKDAGAEPGIFSNIFVPGAQASQLIANECIKGVTFTGSEEAGTSVASQAGKYARKSVLELGGSDPCLVLDENDIEGSVEMVAMGRLSNSGQICTSPKRIIVLESVVDEFIEKAKAIYEKVKVGDPLAEDSQLAPLMGVGARDKVLEQVKDTVQAGATLVCGGKPLEGAGAYMQPTILTGIRPGMRAYSEEVFGPVLAVYAARNVEDAIRLANDTRYGLGATVICRDEEKAVEVARHIDSGMVFINHITTSVPYLPFGGVKKSGYGRELHHEGMKEFTNHKLIRTSSPDAMY